MQRRLWMQIVLVCALLALTACVVPATTPTTSGDSAPVAANESQATEATGAEDTVTELVVALSTMPNSIYMPRAAERNAANAASQLYDSLVWVDDEGNIAP
ncbi:hypothetical protein GC175_18520, partial [bacterium]|nr:hypothetical protein [bacterium]